MPTWEQQVALVRNLDQSFGLAAIVKRTYAIAAEPNGKLRLADVQVPIRSAPDVADGGQGELLDDYDMAPPKIATDVVVMGHAHAPAGAREIPVSVAVGKMARRLSVIGARRTELRPDGSVRFTPPETFTRVPLSPRFAYGGYDAWAQERIAPVPRRVAESVPMPLTGLYAYARNEFGLGWFIDIDRHRADGVLLPQIEDPLDPLVPSRFFVPSAAKWIDAPIAASLGWIHWACYPRMYRLAGDLLHHAPPESPIRESTFPDGDDLLVPWMPEGGRIPPRSLNGASPGLACERLRGDELVILENLHPTVPKIQFYLPGETPVMTLRPPDLKAMSVTPVLQTVRIEPDEGRVSLTFCGTLPLLAPAMSSFIERVELAVSWKK
ncbi:DUF2169 domain-containing protein [Polyangium aurulentum]|uniref:DUF2169 domain-containing protein n=1 Tax=Polyangium aurulentum TaxID=2567896 RepID=UPI0010AE36E6|nr:DUF2169 domain-containing protein [Polyangium aurulentum]UQA54604.1 DUF2169 domain-containing protein [Polyangium aurulentum]